VAWEESPAHSAGSCRAGSSACRVRHRFVFRVGRRGYRVIARPGRRAITPTMRRPLTPPEGSLTRSYHDLRHQPDRSAKEITIDCVWIRIITGDVARPTGCCDKATGAHEAKKEGSKR
jgi:hypothetical protein